MAKLVLTLRAEQQKAFEIVKEQMIIGRHPECDIQIDNKAVSRRHAKVLTISGDSFLEDLGSMNGTYINAEQVQNRALNDGDIVVIGQHKLQYVNEEAQAAHDPALSQVLLRIPIPRAVRETLPGPRTRIPASSKGDSAWARARIPASSKGDFAWARTRIPASSKGLGEYSFAAIDFETANHSPDSACAVGIAFVRNGHIVDLKRYLICPPTREFCFTHIHGLTWEAVKHAPKFPVVWEELAPALSSLDFLAAHNAPFDRRVLEACCRRYGLPQPQKPFKCTVQVARSVWGIRPTKLPDVCRYLRISLTHHEAGSDAKACAQIVLSAMKRGWQP